MLESWVFYFKLDFKSSGAQKVPSEAIKNITEGRQHGGSQLRVNKHQTPHNHGPLCVRVQTAELISPPELQHRCLTDEGQQPEAFVIWETHRST